MYIEERITNNGKVYKYIEYYTDPLSFKKKRISVTLKKNDRQSKKLAEQLLDNKIKNIINLTTNENITFEKLINDYLVAHKKDVKPSTYCRDECHCKIFLKLIGKDVLINNLSARYIREKLDSTEKSNVTKNEYLKHLKSVIRWGFQNDYINDISYLEKIPSYKDPDKKFRTQDKYLENDEINKLLNDIRKSKCQQWIDLTEFLLLSGLRIGEAIALKKTDIDKTVIHINKTCNLQTYDISTPKTYCSDRDIFIQDELMVKLNEIRSHNSSSKISSILLFSENGNYINYNNYRIFLRKHSKKVLGKVITPHALRHTHASMLLSKGISIESISRRLGHTDIATTRKHYIHILEELKEHENQQLKSINII